MYTTQTCRKQPNNKLVQFKHFKNRKKHDKGKNWTLKKETMGGGTNLDFGNKFLQRIYSMSVANQAKPFFFYNILFFKCLIILICHCVAWVLVQKELNA